MRRVVATAGLVVAAACGGGSDPAPARLDARSAWSGGPAWGVVVSGDVVWATDPSRGALIRLDRGGQPPAELASGSPDPRDAGLAVDGDRLWAANLGGTVARFDAATGERLDSAEVGPGEPAAAAVGDGVIWVPLHGPGGTLLALDADSLEEVRRVELPESPFAVAVAGSTVWVAGLDRRLFAVDAATGEVTRTIDIGGSPRGVAVLDGSVWVTVSADREVVRVDADSGEVVARIDTAGPPWPIAAGDGTVWVAELEGRLLRIDAERERIAASVTIPSDARGIALDDRWVWIATQAGGVTRVEVDGPSASSR